MTSTYQWVMLLGAWLLGGCSFPAMFWRKDERPLIKKAFNLNIKHSPPLDYSDSLEEGWIKLAAPGKFFHDWKGIGNRWFHENPKVAYKMSGFITIVLTLVTVGGWLT